jgi:spore coat polysaccharide biosynthesis protein SpsF (cytidylyltransferase family)
MNLCIIQARMGSSRLPGKVLMDVNGKSILQNLLDRLKPSTFVNEFVVATTLNPEDDAIESFCLENNIKCFRGSDWDVLDRFYQCALQLNAAEGDNIVRICCDNPIHSYKVMDFVGAEFLKLGVDYFSNSNQEPNYLEDGYDVEITTFNALKTAWAEAKLLSQREHVMPYIKNSGKFVLGWRKANDKYTFKLSVDTPDDLKMVQRIFKEMEANPNFAIDEVVDLLTRKPEILELNKMSQINSGYKKSLNEDRHIE